MTAIGHKLTSQTVNFNRKQKPNQRNERSWKHVVYFLNDSSGGGPISAAGQKMSSKKGNSATLRLSLKGIFKTVIVENGIKNKISESF